MRDPDRIEPILYAIQRLWEKYPDMRLGQLIGNVYRELPLYYVEDEDLVNVLYDYYDELEKGVDVMRKIRSNK